MKKLLAIILAAFSLAACSKESRTYDYTITDKIMSSNALYSLHVNEYSSDVVKINEYDLDVEYGKSYKRTSAPGASIITIRIQATTPSTVTTGWIPVAYYLTNTKSITIDENTATQKKEPIM